MRKPRSQHAHWMDSLASFRFDVYWRKRRLRELAQDRARNPQKHDWDAVEMHYRKSLAEARSGFCACLVNARAIRRAKQDPLLMGTLHPMDPYWFEHPPLPPSGGAAAT